MKIYASMIINGSDGWGDSFPTLWFCEYLSKSINDASIDLYAGGSSESALDFSSRLNYEILRFIYPDLYGSPISNNNLNNNNSSKTSFLAYKRLKKAFNLINKKPFHHSDYIEKPSYINNWLYKPPSIDMYDEILCTHHHHSETGQSWASPPLRDNLHGGLLPPINTWKNKIELPHIRRMDLNADLLNIMFRESFRPTMPKLKQEVKNELLGLPDEYICVQLRSKDSGPLDKDSPTRNSLTGEKYNEWASNFIDNCYAKWRVPIVITSNAIKVDNTKVIDATNLSLWAKIEAHRSSKYSYVAHSGFGMIVAVYRGLKEIKLINPSCHGIYRNPPVLLFSNVLERNPDTKYTSSPPGWVDQYDNWEIDFQDSLNP